MNDYVVTIRNDRGIVERRFALWSPYYLLERPARMEYTVPPLAAGSYTVTVKARGFWYNESDNCLETAFSVDARYWPPGPGMVLNRLSCALMRSDCGSVLSDEESSLPHVHCEVCADTDQPHLSCQWCRRTRR